MASQKTYGCVALHERNYSIMRKKGQRVYYSMEHKTTKEERRIYGTIERDSIEGWDYDDVAYDDAPTWIQPVLCYYLHDAPEDDKRTGKWSIFPDGTELAIS